MGRVERIFHVRKPIIGMVHLRPLPGAALYNPAVMDMTQILDIAVEEAKMLEDAGVDGVQVENMWDIPYLPPQKIGFDTVAALAVSVRKVSESVSIPVGAECHMNAAQAALSCAVAGDAKWIRVFEFCNAFISQSGFIDAAGGEIARQRRNLQADGIAFLCDVNVKHGSHFIIHDRSIEEQAMDIEAQDGDAVIVTGFDTGMPPTADRVRSCKAAVGLPIILGSGITEANARELLTAADGAIVGSGFKKDGNWKNPVDFNRTKSFMDLVKSLRSELDE